MKQFVSMPLSDGSHGKITLPVINKEKILGQISQWNLADKTWLLSKLAFDIHHHVATDDVSATKGEASSDDDTVDRVTMFFDNVRRTALLIEKATLNKPIKQAARGGILRADFIADPVITVLDYIAYNYRELVRDYLEQGKSMAQCVCAFYGGLYAQHLLGNITKAVIAECLKSDEIFSDYNIDTLKKNMSPDSKEGWYKDIYKVIEEGGMKS